MPLLKTGKKIKSCVQSVLRLRVSLKLSFYTDKTATFQIAKQSTESSPGIAPGWYMIEVGGDQQTIGVQFTITGHFHGKKFDLDGPPYEAGHQRIQLGTTAVTRRIIYLNEHCNTFVVSSTTAIIEWGSVNIQLSRLSARFASDRIKTALDKWQVGYLPTSTTLALYSHYLRLCPAPTINQTYVNWCTSQSSTSLSDTSASKLLDNWAKKITVITISEHALNQKVSKITTPFVLVKDGAVKFKSAFAQVLTETVDASDCSLLWYFDHDHHSPDAAPVNPCFKPGWNPGLLLQGNYIGAAFICRNSLFNSVGGIDRSYGESAIYDFLLRASHKLSESNVRHVAQITYCLPDTSYQHPHGFFLHNKDKIALASYLKSHRKTHSTIKSGPYPGTYSIEHDMASLNPSVEIIIPTRDRIDLLERCISSIVTKTVYRNYRITVVNNDSKLSSTKKYFQSLSVDPRLQMIDYPGEFNFSAINNLAVKQSEAEIVVLLNNDTEVTQSAWLSRLASEALQPGVACVGAKLRYPNGLIQHAGVIVGMQGIAGHLNRFAQSDEDGYAGSLKFSADFSAVTGACLAIRRAVYNKIGGLDAKHLAVAYNDVDLCLRAREAGYRNRLLADVELIHHESVSRKSDLTGIRKACFDNESNYMKARHARFITDDPAWNPNFLRNSPTPCLASKMLSDKTQLINTVYK